MARTHNLRPRARRARTWRTPLGGLIAAALAAGSFGVLVHPSGFICLAGLITVLLVGLLWPLLTIAGVTATARFACLRAREGDSVRLILDVRNRLPWRSSGLVLELAGNGAVAGTAHVLSAVPRWCVSKHVLELVTPLRGLYPNGPVKLRCGFPFGLLSATRDVAVTSELIVWPQTFAAPRFAGGVGDGASSAEQKAGAAGAWAGVRPYRRGDPSRSVHWGQSAKHDRLIVVERHADVRPAVRLVLDVEPTIHVGSGRDASLEWAIRIAASVVASAVRDEVAAEVYVGGERFDVFNDRHLSRLFDALAKLPVAGHAGGLDDSPDERSSSRAASAIVVTTDRRLARSADARRRGAGLIVLRTSGFGGDVMAEPPASRTQRGALLIEDPADAVTKLASASRTPAAARRAHATAC